MVCGNTSTAAVYSVSTGGLNKDTGCKVINWCAYKVVSESNCIKYQDWDSKRPHEDQVQLHEVLKVGAHDRLYRWERGATAPPSLGNRPRAEFEPGYLC